MIEYCSNCSALISGTSYNGCCDRKCSITYDKFIDSITPPFDDNCISTEEACEILDVVLPNPVKKSTFNMCM